MIRVVLVARSKNNPYCHLTSHLFVVLYMLPWVGTKLSAVCPCSASRSEDGRRNLCRPSPTSVVVVRQLQVDEVSHLPLHLGERPVLVSFQLQECRQLPKCHFGYDSSVSRIHLTIFPVRDASLRGRPPVLASNLCLDSWAEPHFDFVSPTTLDGRAWLPVRVYQEVCARLRCHRCRSVVNVVVSITLARRAWFALRRRRKKQTYKMCSEGDLSKHACVWMDVLCHKRYYSQLGSTSQASKEQAYSKQEHIVNTEDKNGKRQKIEEKRSFSYGFSPERSFSIQPAIHVDQR